MISNKFAHNRVDSSSPRNWRNSPDCRGRGGGGRIGQLLPFNRGETWKIQSRRANQVEFSSSGISADASNATRESLVSGKTRSLTITRIFALDRRRTRDSSSGCFSRTTALFSPFHSIFTYTSVQRVEPQALAAFPSRRMKYIFSLIRDETTKGFSLPSFHSLDSAQGILKTLLVFISLRYSDRRSLCKIRRGHLPKFHPRLESVFVTRDSPDRSRFPSSSFA